MQVRKDRLEARLFARHAKIVRDIYRDPDSHPELGDEVALWHRRYRWDWSFKWYPTAGRLSCGFRRWVWDWVGCTAGVYRDDARGYFRKHGIVRRPDQFGSTDFPRQRREDAW